MAIEEVFIDDIVTDAGTQIRTSINEEKVGEYAESMRNGSTFPPIRLIHDGSRYILADGFHRLFAAMRINEIAIKAEVEPGTLRDAVKIALSANSKHGLPRTNEDKRRSVLKALADSEWCGWPARDVARLCDVSHTMVIRIREECGLKVGDVYTGSVENLIAKRKMEKAEKKAEAKPRELAVEEPKKPEPKETEPAQPDYDERDVAIEELSAENERLLDRLGAQAFEGTEEEKSLLQETINDLRQEVERLSRERDSALIRATAMQKENAEMKKQLNYWEKRVRALEKQAA